MYNIFLCRYITKQMLKNYPNAHRMGSLKTFRVPARTFKEAIEKLDKYGITIEQIADLVDTKERVDAV